MNLHQQIAHYSAVRHRLFNTKPKPSAAKSCVVSRDVLPPRHRLDSPRHYERPIGPPRVISDARDMHAHRVSDVSPVRSMRDAKRQEHATAQRIVCQTAIDHGVPLDALLGQARISPYIALRAIAVHRCIAAGCSYNGVARVMCRDHTTIRNLYLTRNPDGTRIVPMSGGVQ